MEASQYKNLMTEGAVWKKIVFFALPLFLGNLFQQLYNTADSLIVGNFLGENALAAVSSSGNLIFLMVGFFSGIAIGAGVVIACYFGAKNYALVEKAVHTTVAFALRQAPFLQHSAYGSLRRFSYGWQLRRMCCPNPHFTCALTSWDRRGL